jgi:O-succinylbenzoic acid--CoA ligase
MPSPFHSLTVDGIALREADIGRWADELVARHRSGAWASDLRSTLRELLSGEGVMNTRTSGTTGMPRSHAFSTADLVASAAITREAFDLKPGDRTLLCLPCEFVGGKMMLVRTMLLGLDLHAIDPRGGVLRNLRTADRFRFAAMVPMQLHTALQHDRDRVEAQFDTVLLGGGPVSEAMIERLQGLRTRVLLGYGSTEMLTHVALRMLNGEDRTEEYTALGGVTFGMDDRSCLIVRTPHLTVKEHVTNDIADLVDERRMRWMGRRDNVILSGGRKIHPERLEAMTAGIVPYPHFFAALPDERLGQSVVLVLETGNDKRQAPPEVAEDIKGVLYEHERPHRVIAVRDFLRTGSGKVDRAGTLALLSN